MKIRNREVKMALFINEQPGGNMCGPASWLRAEPRDIFITMFAFEDGNVQD